MRIMKAQALSMAFLGMLAAAQAQNLPGTSLCDYDTIYDTIKTGNIVEVTLTVRYRDCPANRENKPCRAENGQGFAPGPLLDGVQASNVIMVNDEIPGPEIRAKLGDTVRVNVINMLGEPTSMHFHGITQFRTPFMDGDEGISNCPIAAGQTHIYEFIAHPAGTTFYHSHSSSQRVSGMTGPLIIEDDKEPNADITDKVVFLQDWYHETADDNFEFWAQNTPGNCISFGGSFFTGAINPRRDDISHIGAVVGDGKFFQSFIVNGEGIYNYPDTQVNEALEDFTFQNMQCPGQTTQPVQCEFCTDQSNWTETLCNDSSQDRTCGAPHVIEVEAGTATRLRFVHGGALFGAQVCIDGHSVDIVGADGSHVEPHATDCFIIFPAERYDAVITPQTPGDHWIRFTTLDQQTAAAFDVDSYAAGFPHHGFSILRVMESPDEQITNDYSYLTDMTPQSCSDTVVTNCGSGYWLNSTTMGCSVSASQMDPGRCITSFDALKAASSPNDDASICRDKKMAHEVSPTYSATAKLSFIPDEVPRWNGIGLNSRIEILTEEEFGFPYVTPDDPSEWWTGQPISFVNPDVPPLSLHPELRTKLYAERTTFLQLDADNSLGPEGSSASYPQNFAKGVFGTNAVAVEYGEVVRIYFSCTEPFGPGCAMPHPMHLHGHRMAILYVGGWNETYDESKFNQNPVYRDTVTVHTDAFAVVQVAAVNPGAWRWHCHVNIHHRSGMAMLLDVGGNAAVEAVRRVPDSANLCPTGLNSSSGRVGPALSLFIATASFCLTASFLMF